MAWLKITWVTSYIGLNDDQRRVVQSLGLRRLHQSAAHIDSPSIRGMVMKVKHLVNVSEISDSEAETLKAESQKRHTPKKPKSKAAVGAASKGS